MRDSCDASPAELELEFARRRLRVLEAENAELERVILELAREIERLELLAATFGARGRG